MVDVNFGQAFLDAVSLPFAPIVHAFESGDASKLLEYVQPSSWVKTVQDDYGRAVTRQEDVDNALKWSKDFTDGVFARDKEAKRVQAREEAIVKMKKQRQEEDAVMSENRKTDIANFENEQKSKNIPVLGTQAVDPEEPESLRLLDHGREPRSDLLEPSEYEKLKADVTFDMFSTVQAGFGQGANNKLVIANDIKDAVLHGGFHFFPRPWTGPTGGPDLKLTLLQDVLPKNSIDVKLNNDSRKRRQVALAKYGSFLGDTSGVLGSDIGYNFVTTDKGLKRLKMRSCLEPIVMNSGVFRSILPETGAAYAQRSFRKLYDPLRDAEAFGGTLRANPIGQTNSQVRAKLEPLK